MIDNLKSNDLDPVDYTKKEKAKENTPQVNFADVWFNL
jgi:hypothetical protein